MKPISLNAQIAKKVFKYTHVEFNGSRYQYLNKEMSKERGGIWYSEIPNYSGSWDGAGLVIEKMKKRGLLCQIQIKSWGASVAFKYGNIDSDPHWQRRWVDHESVTIAICMAALESLKEKR